MQANVINVYKLIVTNNANSNAQIEILVGPNIWASQQVIAPRNTAEFNLTDMRIPFLNNGNAFRVRALLAAGGIYTDPRTFTYKPLSGTATIIIQ